MSGCGPFVVVVAGVAEKVGKSTIANNLAVYLKALREDLPVTLTSFESQSALDDMFSLGDARAGTVADFLTSGDLESVSRMGQFGVYYLSSHGQLPQPGDPARLRRTFAQDDRDGVLIIDAGIEMGELWRSAVWAADLVLAPVGDHQSLSRLKTLRSTLLEGGGSEEMLWLLPSRLGDTTDSAPGVDNHQLIRFAADERGCQVLDQELSEDQRVHLQASGKARSVLTRLPGSYVHEELRQLAEFVLQKHTEGPDTESRKRRMLDDGLLPQRARRVGLECPLCGKLATGSRVHYLEALPSRHRSLLHADCFELLLEGTSLHAFLPLTRQLLVETGVEGRGLRAEIRLHLTGAKGEFDEQEQLLPEKDSGWDRLLRVVTERGLNEQHPGLLAISVEGKATALLNPNSYALFARQWRKVRRRLFGGEAY